MQHFEFLIVGQGIAGTLLSAELIRLGKSVFVTDKTSSVSSSKVAGAVLNPVVVNGKTRNEELSQQVEFAVKKYKAIEDLLGVQFIESTSIIKFHESAEEEESFLKRISDSERNIHSKSVVEEKNIDSVFIANHSYSIINPASKVNSILLIDSWRRYLEDSDLFSDQYFEYDLCRVVENGFQYKDFSFQKIIFCEGAAVGKNPFIRTSGFIPNRGDVLILEIPELSGDYIYQKKFRLIPRESGIFWYGSNYKWQFSDLNPDLFWKESALAELENWLRLPYKVADHLVAERPTTAGQQIQSGPVSGYPGMYIFNGLGTKGFTAGPLNAARLANILTGSGF